MKMRLCGMFEIHLCIHQHILMLYNFHSLSLYYTHNTKETRVYAM